MEGNPDVIFAVDRDEVAHCVPGAFLKVIDLLRQRPQHLHEVFSIICLWACRLVIADCVSSSFAFAASNFETSHLSLTLSGSWRMVSLAAEILYRPCDQRPCRVDILLSSYLELLFSLHLYRGRSLVFNNRFLLWFQKFVKLAQNPTFLFVNILLSGM